MYYGQFQLDKFLHERYFNNVRDGFFVECGALDGLTECSCKFFEESLGWTGMNIEACPPLYERLVRNRPLSNNLNLALSNYNGKATFKHAIAPGIDVFGNGSLTHKKEHIDQLVNQGCQFVNYEVTCSRFSDLFIQNREIDLFVLDVEGHELQALQGIISIGHDLMPKVFCIEYGFSGLENIQNVLGNKYKLDVIEKNNSIFVKL